MKAALLKRWNHLELSEIEKPSADRTEAVLKVIYGGVCGSDITVYSGQHPTAAAPVVLCHEILGRIDQLPPDYDGDLHVGDRVLADPVVSCGECFACENGIGNVCENLKLLGIHINGGFAQYVRVPLDRLVRVDDRMPDQIAALGEPFAVAYHVNRRAGTKRNDRVLLIGAGAIGMITAAAARRFGAQVTISEINKERLALAASFDFETVDTSAAGGREELRRIAGKAGFDIVFDASGSKEGTLILPDLCRPGGKLVSLGLSSMPHEFVIGKVSFKELTLVGSRLYSHEDFVSGVQMLQALSASYDFTRIISDILPLDHVPQALRMMQEGKNLGKILISCNGEPGP